jgi:putative NADPH-quinone reductase
VVLIFPVWNGAMPALLKGPRTDVSSGVHLSRHKAR